MSADAPLIELRDVSRSFVSKNSPEVHALSGVDLVIHSGEYVAIVGPSGGGKTTLMNILGLLDEPTGGEYHFRGEQVSTKDNSVAPSVRAMNIGYIFQAFHLLEGRAAIDSAELGLLYQGVQPEERRRIAGEALAMVGLGDRGDQLTSTLSGGQRQRVAIARAMASGAQLILADEPTGNLDSANAARVLDELDRLREGGATVVVVTHAPEVAERADRVVHIVDGKIDSDTGAPPDPQAKLEEGAANEVERPDPDTTRRTRAKIRFADLVRDAWVSIGARSTHTFAQCVAVAIAVALAVTTFGLAASSRSQVSATFDAHLNREVTARWNNSISHSPDLLNVPSLIQDIPGVDAASVLLDLSVANVSTFAGTRETRPHIAIGNLQDSASVDIDIASWHTGDLAADEAYVGDLLAKDLHLADVDLAPTVEIDGKEYRVAGIITKSSRLPLLRGELVVGPPADLAERSGDTSLLVMTSPGAAQQVASQIAVVINPYRADNVVVQAPTDPTQLRGEIETGVQATLIAFTLLALVIAIAALTNATLLSLNARRGEIGIRKALGARNRQIGLLVTIESIFIGVLGGVVGLFIGMLAVLAVSISQRWTPVLDITILPLAIICGTVIGAAGGGIASIRAARLNPADNLRS